jgi:lysophospholipase L1-like esterase
MGHRKRAWKIVGLVAILLVGVAVAVGVWRLSAMRSAEFWEPAIAAFEEQDAEHPPSPGAIVFTGSSSIRMWKSLEADMAPLPVLNRGFGGSHIAHVNQYTDRIVVPYAPRAVVLYAGDNDLAAGSDKTPASVLGDFQRFVSLVSRLGSPSQGDRPSAPVYFLAIKPSLARWDRWPLMRQANARIEAWADETERVVYVDVATPMLGADGEPRPELFIADGLHMSAEGYALWTTILKPVLLAGS